MSRYTAEDIEVLSGLEPVRRRPGMYTDTSRPNHLVQEVVDNSVDEAVAGHARNVDVTVYKDGSVEVRDDGRGMPVDIHPEEGIPGIELILTRLHAGGKFSNKNYQFAGGLHGVGVSVVNALSARLEINVNRDGKEHQMSFAHGDVTSSLKWWERSGNATPVPGCGSGPTPSISIRPESRCGNCATFCEAKAVLCPGLTVNLLDESSGDTDDLVLRRRLQRLSGRCPEGLELIPPELILGDKETEHEAAQWALCWVPEGEGVQESYVNLIPTPLGGTHVNGLRTGLTDALREFCDIHNLLPRGLKLVPEDVWDRLSYILSIKLEDPAVQWPDQGTAVQPRGRGIGHQHHQGRFQPVAQHPR